MVDVSSTAVTTHFDDDKLASAAWFARHSFRTGEHPGVAQPKMDVGGNGALALQDYTAYGLRSVLGVHRNEVEGIRVGGANGSSDNYLSDYASFAEIAVTAVGHSAAMPDPGILGPIREQVRRERLSRQTSTPISRMTGWKRRTSTTNRSCVA